MRKLYETILMLILKKKHHFHLVENSQLPFVTSSTIILLLISFVLYFHPFVRNLMHGYDNILFHLALFECCVGLFIGFLIVLVEVGQGYHTGVVRNGLKFGIIFFLVFLINFDAAIYYLEKAINVVNQYDLDQIIKQKEITADVGFESSNPKSDAQTSTKTSNTVIPNLKKNSFLKPFFRFFHIGSPEQGIGTLLILVLMYWISGHYYNKFLSKNGGWMDTKTRIFMILVDLVLNFSIGIYYMGYRNTFMGMLMLKCPVFLSPLFGLIELVCFYVYYRGLKKSSAVSNSKKT